MALIVEDGTGVANADTYVSLNDADTYHENRNNTDWSALSDDEKEGRLRRAAQYLDAHYNWQGSRVLSTQARIWPRDGVANRDGVAVASDTVPSLVVEAQQELAVVIPQTQQVTEPSRLARVKAGSVEVEYEDAPLPREVVTLVDELVREYVRATGILTRA